MLKVLVGLAAVAAAVFFGWRRRRAAGVSKGEMYESEGMLRVGPVPDASASDAPSQA